MRSFVRVADLHSFTRAADALGVSRAVVSTHVAELERHLRCQLFHRTTRRVGLTSDGAEYLARCQRILAELEAADETLRRTRLSPQGRLRVDVPVVFGRARMWQFQRGAVRKQLSLTFNVAFNSVEAQIMAAIRNAGIVQTMDLVVAEALATGRLEVVLREWSAPGAPISVVCRSALRDSPKIRVFADFATELLLQYRRRVDALLD
jgi:DNA-binding transcriptional LysR family regulator